jgi:pimeloyl-ACP methyl ester carboxylesterase
MITSTSLRLCLLLLLVGVVCYGCYLTFFYLLQRSLLFPRHLLPVRAGPTPHVPGLEQHWLTTSQGRVEAWYLPPSDRASTGKAPLIIGHGNAERIDDWLAAVTGLRRMGVGVLLVEYPGYGRSQGSPTQASITETFVAAYDAILDHPQVDPTKIILFGRSVGGGVVAALSAQRPSAALILLSTFTDVRSFARRYGLPRWAVRDPFDTLAVVRAYRQPVLILHGQHDRTIPYAHAVALQQAARQGELVPLACDHNDCVTDWDHFWQALQPFLGRAGMGRGHEEGH